MRSSIEKTTVLHHESVGVIITCPAHGTFMFQLNGKEHPDPRCHDKYQLWGGHMKPDEVNDPYRALRRELHEEWRAHDVADEVLARVEGQTAKNFVLKSSGGTDHPYFYRFHTLLAIADRETFMDWFARLEKAGFNEGSLSVLERKTVYEYIYFKNGDSPLLGNLATALDYYVRFDEALCHD